MSARRGIAVLAAALLVIGAGCGTRRSQADLAAAATAGGGGQSAPAASVTPTAAEDRGGAEAPEPGGAPTPGTPNAAPVGTAAAGAGATPASGAASARAASAGSNPASTATSAGRVDSPRTATAAGPAGNTAARPAASPAGPPAGATPATGRSPVRIGSVGTISGVLGETFKGNVIAVQVWAKWINEKGGLAGHPVEVRVIDDGQDPARHRAALQELIEKDGVIAIVSDIGILGLQADSVRYVESKRVPIVGGDALNELWYSSPMLFPQMAAGDAKLWSQMAAAADTAGRGAKFGYITCQEAQICRDSDKAWPEYAKRNGLTVAYRTQASLTQPSFTAECLAARNAGVEILFLGLDTNSERRAAANCTQQGYHPVFGLVQAKADMGAEAALDQAVFPSNVFPWVAKDTPAAAEFHQVMARYAPNLALSYDLATGWVAAKLFERAAGALGERPTSEDVLRGLWSLRDDTLGGLAPPLTFREGQPAPATFCYWPIRIGGRAWTAPRASQPVCRPRS